MENAVRHLVISMVVETWKLANQLVENCQAVLFDFDGVIIDTEWPIYESWKRVFEGEGHELKVETYVKCIGSDFDTWSPEKYLQSLTAKSYEWDVINAKRQVELESDLVGVETLPGVRDLISRLKSDGKKLAVVSSSSHDWVDMWLEKLDLMKEMDEVVCKGDAPKIKPAPDLYMEAVKRFDLEASDCLVIEDSLNGVISAKAAGCIAMAVPSRLTSCLDFRIADVVVPALTL